MCIRLLHTTRKYFDFGNKSRAADEAIAMKAEILQHDKIISALNDLKPPELYLRYSGAVAVLLQTLSIQ